MPGANGSEDSVERAREWKSPAAGAREGATQVDRRAHDSPPSSASTTSDAAAPPRQCDSRTKCSGLRRARRSCTVPLRYAVASAAGNDSHGRPKTNQDAYGLKLRFMGLGHAHLMLVADGHGGHGHDVSRAVVDQFPALLESHLRQSGGFDALSSSCGRIRRRNVDELHELVARAARGACLELDDAIDRDPAIDDSISGTTLVALLVVSRIAFVVNVGDSRCVLGHVDGDDVDDASSASSYSSIAPAPAPQGPPSRAAAQGRDTVGIAPAPLSPPFSRRTAPPRMAVSARPLSFPHTPVTPAERARVERSGGIVQPIRRADGTFAGPQRVWSGSLEHHTPGLAVSRSIGDRFAKAVGVIAAPSVSRFALTPSRDACIVIASDGVWDVLADEAVMRLACSAKGDACKAAADICYAARDAWKAKGHRRRIDDITAFAVLLWPGKTRSELRSMDAPALARSDVDGGPSNAQEARPLFAQRSVSESFAGRDAVAVSLDRRAKSSRSTLSEPLAAADSPARPFTNPSPPKGLRKPNSWRGPLNAVRALARLVQRPASTGAVAPAPEVAAPPRLVAAAS